MAMLLPRVRHGIATTTHRCVLPGFFRIIRGVNLAGIETGCDGAMYVAQIERAEVGLRGVGEMYEQRRAASCS